MKSLLSRIRRRDNLPRPDKPLKYPDGLMVGTEKSVYYVRNGLKYELFSERALESWNLPIIQGSEASLSTTPRGTGYLGFRDGVLIHNYASGKVYLISGNKRRHITSPDVYEKYGLDQDNIVIVSEDETKLHEEGEPLK